jgi:hypothetical protein
MNWAAFRGEGIGTMKPEEGDVLIKGSQRLVFLRAK